MLAILCKRHITKTHYCSKHSYSLLNDNMAYVDHLVV